MKKDNFLIYGSYGYTGNLIAKLACQQGLRPVLAGRHSDKLKEQAKKLNLDYLVLDLEDLNATKLALAEFIAVVHCAGPFIHTYKNMAQACLETQTHYTDITGEYEVIEGLMAMNEQARAMKIMLLPGAGFDVVPSDCLAKYLKNQLPDAVSLCLAIKSLQDKSESGSSISQGTAKTILEGFGKGSRVRDQGQLKTVPMAWKTREFNFGDQKSTVCMTISWGDLASAWWSTGIPHIETYMATPAKLIRLYKIMNPIKSLLNCAWIKGYLQKRINRMPPGPSDDMRIKSRSAVYGEAVNASGNRVVALIQGPSGYDLTALAVLVIIKKILGGNAPIGFQTPSTAYTQDLILEIPNTSRLDLS